MATFTPFTPSTPFLFEVITGLLPSTTYSFEVIAFNSSGNSVASTIVTATTTAGGVPNSPSGLTSPSLTATSVTLQWTAPTTGPSVTSYQLQFALSGSGNFSNGPSVPSTAVTGTVTGLQSATKYDFRVEAVNATGASAPSLLLTVTTFAGTGVVGSIPGLLFSDEFTSWNLYNPFVAGGSGGVWYPGAPSVGYDNGKVEDGCFNMSPFSPNTPFTVFSQSGSIGSVAFINTPPQFLAACQNKPFVTSTVNTQPTFSHQYGYIEFRASVPGNYPGIGGAMWLLPADGSWPPEIDVNEWGGINGSGMNVSHPVAIIPSGEWPPNNSVYNPTDQGQDPHNEDFHNWAIDWRADGADWYMDGQVVNSGSPLPDLLNQPMYLILQINSGDDSESFSNGTVHDTADLPVQTRYDYVRWWVNKAAHDAAGLTP